VRRGFLWGMMLLLAASGGMAQETSTERDAARDVMKQIGGLSQSLGVMSLVAKLAAADKGRDEVIGRVKQLMQTDLLPMSDWITQHPEMRDAVKTEFTHIQALFGEYQDALKKAYPKPEIAEPK